ncbi:hypothetical protein TMES_08145 [Thalassospira mesophila]|uniref:Cell division coordinator CpoB n=1 Tax=Thalassospira mesophila TaxID=1293891 RepID=A0A1Y2L278_9PROT|nr:hypothetical protein TMES_08145 [Thalassospira mesophila]
MARRPSLFARMGSLVILGFLTVGFASPVMAQDASVSRQVDQLRKDLDVLQRYVYREGPPAASGAVASGSGADNTPAAARQQVQIDNLQGQITQLTGQIEEQGYKVRQMSDRLDRLISDVDFRLSQLEGKTTQTGQSDGGAAAGAGAGAVAGGLSSANTGANAASDGASASGSNGGGGLGGDAGQPLDKNGTRLFGVIKGQGNAPEIPSGPQAGAKGAASAGAAAAGAAAATGATDGVLPGGTPQDQYRYAFGLLRQQKFPEAQAALSAFVKAHPKDPLAGNAQYWLGETFYVRGNYDQASLAFTEGFQNYPDSPKAADNLLKLGMSLANLGKTDDACLTYDHLLANFEGSSTVILDRARQEKKNRNCK